MTLDLAALRDGDIYNWHWTDAELAKRADYRNSGTLYWCEDRQAIARNGQLLDTYWAGHELAPGGDCHVVDPMKVDLTFVCNLNDVRRISEHEAKYYDAADVFNISYHAGYRKLFAVKPDAKRSQTAMLAWIDAKVNDVCDEIAAGQRHVERLLEDRAKVAAGNTEVSIG
jgi:hypothetical protein